jgi:hypothetical protein
MGVRVLLVFAAELLLGRCDAWWNFDVVGAMIDLAIEIGLLL